MMFLLVNAIEIKETFNSNCNVLIFGVQFKKSSFKLKY